jgi:steroid 5-alpha reductase family enzyme
MFEVALPMVAWGAFGVSLLMVLTWVFHLRTRNAGWVDVAWAYGLGGLAVIFAWLGPGDPQRRLLVGLLGGLWSLRLGTHLFIRVWQDPHEDGRYSDLRAEWGGNLALKFFGFFQFQALLDLLLAWPFLLASLDPTPGIHPVAWVGVALWVVSLVGEFLADAQLRRFKQSPLNRGRVCRDGLWNFSRHPNYFFEWLIWVAFALLATPSPWGWTAWACPLLMLYFLVRVTGIPATEAQSLRTKGEAYRRYQREVSAFVPWFPRGGQ